MASLFTQIIEGDMPGHFVWKDEVWVAFLSIFPISEGHTLVVPRLEVGQWTDLPPDVVSHCMLVAQKISTVIKALYACERVGLVVAGFEIPHTHVHLLVVNDMSDFDFSAAQAADPELLAANASKIVAELQQRGHTEAEL